MPNSILPLWYYFIFVIIDPNTNPELTFLVTTLLKRCASSALAPSFLFLQKRTLMFSLPVMIPSHR